MDTNVQVKRVTEDLKLPLCMDAAGKRLQLVRFENPSKKVVRTVTVNPGRRRFGIPPQGEFYCVLCEEAFVQPMQTLWIYGRRAARVRDGYASYTFDEEGMSCRREDHGWAYPGYFGLDPMGNVCVGEYRFPVGENGHPVVYIRHEIGIDAAGLPVGSVKDRLCFPKDQGLFMATDRGRLCVSNRRKLLYYGECVLKDERIADIVCCDHGYVALTVEGVTQYSSDGVKWQKLGDRAVAIAAAEDTVAVADRDGNVSLYQHDGHCLFGCGKLHFPNKHISELAVSDVTAIVKFSDCSFDIVNWQSGKTCVENMQYLKPW